MKHILHIGHADFLLPANAEYILNLSRALEGIQRLRIGGENESTYHLEPAEYSCEMLSDAAFTQRYPLPHVEPNNHDDQILRSKDPDSESLPD